LNEVDKVIPQFVTAHCAEQKNVVKQSRNNFPSQEFMHIILARCGAALVIFFAVGLTTNELEKNWMLIPFVFCQPPNGQKNQRKLIG
jgi:hypothetical protein